MRETVKIQPTLAEPWLDAPYAKELKVISDLLDNDRKLAAEVVQDLRPNAVPGHRGMTGDLAPPFWWTLRSPSVVSLTHTPVLIGHFLEEVHGWPWRMMLTAVVRS